MGIKDIRRNYILERAIKLFCTKPMAEVKIKDVAEACNIGEATFYRYFYKRSSLIVACALKLSEMM
ncbi:MAG: helix-turn-helix transcriptional regulator, partial [Clostridia bacterium]|nr:helix-turn-helix transcriptional regulator [Clostridia bacterium]